MSDNTEFLGMVASIPSELVPPLAEVLSEVEMARSTYPPFHNAHEGYAVIKEEVDELWDEIKRKKQNMEAIHREAVQVAAMAIRFLLEIQA